MAHVLTTRARAVLVLPPPEKRLRPAVFTSMPLMLVANYLGKGSVLLLRQTCQYFYQELLSAVTYNLSLHIGFASVCSAVPINNRDPSRENKLATRGVRLPAWVYRGSRRSTGTGITNAAAVKRMMTYLSLLACPLRLTVHDISPYDCIFVGGYRESHDEVYEAARKNALLLRYVLDSKVQLQIHTFIINRLTYDRERDVEPYNEDFMRLIRGRNIAKDFTKFANLQRLDVSFAYTGDAKLESRLMAAIGAIPKLTQLTLRGCIPGDDAPINAFVNSRPVGAKPLKIELARHGNHSLEESWMLLLKCAVSFKVSTELWDCGLKLILKTIRHMPTHTVREITVTVSAGELRFLKRALDKFQVYNERLPVEQRVRLVINEPVSVDP